MKISIYEALRQAKVYRTDAGGFYLQRLLSDHILILHRANRWSSINYAVVCLCLWTWAPWYIAASTMLYMGIDTLVTRVCAKKLRDQTVALVEPVIEGKAIPTLAAFHPSQWID